MRLKLLFNKFYRDQSGAVTVDYVVLVGMLIALSIGILASIQSASDDTMGKVTDLVREQQDRLDNAYKE